MYSRNIRVYESVSRVVCGVLSHASVGHFSHLDTRSEFYAFADTSAAWKCQCNVDRISGGRLCSDVWKPGEQKWLGDLEGERYRAVHPSAASITRRGRGRQAAAHSTGASLSRFAWNVALRLWTLHVRLSYAMYNVHVPSLSCCHAGAQFGETVVCHSAAFLTGSRQSPRLSGSQLSKQITSQSITPRRARPHSDSC